MSEQDLVREVLFGETPSDTRDGFIGHTPTPWFVSRDTRPDMWWNNHIASVADPNIEICSMFHDNTPENARGEANAAFIVRACNAHDDLIETLHEVAEFLDNQSDVEDGDYGVPRPNRAMQLLIEVRNAIFKATGVTHV